MADNIKKLSPKDGIDHFTAAIADIKTNTAVYAVYEDEPNLDDDGNEIAAGVLIPVDAWNEYATMRNAGGKEAEIRNAQNQLQLDALRIQVEQASQESRIQAVKLALETVQTSANSSNSYTAALLKNAKDIHAYLTQGTVPEGGLNHGS